MTLFANIFPETKSTEYLLHFHNIQMHTVIQILTLNVGINSFADTLAPCITGTSAPMILNM